MSARDWGSTAVPALGVTAVVTVIVVAVTGVFIAGRAEPRPEAVRAETPATGFAWRQGACVGRNGSVFRLVPCGEADGRVISVVGGRPADCPGETDEIVRIRVASETGEQFSPSLRTDRTACVRNLRQPHPGDPGEGGGVLRPGDCLALRGGERPCSASGWYGRVLALVDRTDECPRRALDALLVDERSIACLGEGRRMLSVGDCVVRPAGRKVSREALSSTSCGSSRAWAEVTGRVVSRGRCPEGSDRYLKVREPGVRRPVTCLRRVALHGSP
ncbi:hypothetical protein [Planomonospora venezuelensis]|uniref:Uncharacterized protein n=1 Tax=Planomonospora venezuelensis TaxID=1999 RepID=A0A841CZD6_PLAVE|nr:hypothetical protein [Planomonospora venezuelensis]MBB5962830.1 hypothetical protein [Planomonospora venezuelensis]GIM99374.1 hypothetical protein Pve01_10330 [Planomonospora venezuelensis]